MNHNSIEIEATELIVSQQKSSRSRSRPKQRDFFPLIGRLRISLIVDSLKGTKSNRELAVFLNEFIQNNPNFSYAVKQLGEEIFNKENLNRLLHAGEEEGNMGFEPALLQFISPLVGFTFGDLMMILANQGCHHMGEIEALIFRAIHENGLTDDHIKARLERLNHVGFGLEWESFTAFGHGERTPNQDELRVIKEILDPYETLISEAQWVDAMNTDNNKSGDDEGNGNGNGSRLESRGRKN